MPRLLLVIAFLLAPLQAAAQDIFTVPEVPVFAEAETSGEAREVARDQGRRVALDLLLRRLVAEEDWTYLPRLAEEKPAPALENAYEGAYRDPAFTEDFAFKQPVTIDPEAIDAFEQETNVFGEKSSGTTYRANITYRFKPEAIRSLLQGARLPYSEEQAREVVILPVLETSNGLYLWEAKNPWARAWLERPLTNELTPMVLPQGDLVDVEAINAEEARELNTPALRAFHERYSADRLLIALGRLREANGEFRLSVQLIEATPPSIEGGAVASAIGTEVTEAFFRGADDDFPALARRAVETTVQRHARQWKRQTLVDYALERTFELTAWFGNQREWSEIQEAIDSTALVRKRERGPFNRENAITTLTVVGAEEQFDLAMQQRGLDVWQDSTGRWHIAKNERAEQLQAMMEPLTTDLDAQVERRRGLGRFFRRGGRVEETELAPIEGGGESGETEEGEAMPELSDDLFGDGN